MPLPPLALVQALGERAGLLAQRGFIRLQSAAGSLGDAVSWAQHQVRTMSDTDFMIAFGGFVLVLGLVMRGIRPKY